MLFRGLVFLKRGLKVVLLFSKEPFFWTYRWFFKPVVTWGYLGYRRVRKWALLLIEPAQSRAMAILANRYSVHVAIVGIAVAVVASNLHSGTAAYAQELEQQRSIVSDIILGEEDAVTIEERTETPEETTYLSSQAVSAYEAVSAEQYDGTDDGLYEDDPSEIALVSPFGTAVRVEPEIAPDDRPPTRTQVEQYVVQSGDTIGGIARRFGLSTATLLASNGLTARSYIQPGQSLKILPFDGIPYKVKSGDTLAKIAKTYDSDAQKILEANGLASGTALSVGMELLLPDGRLPPPPAPKRPAQIATSIKNVITPPPSPDRASRGMVWPTAARRITQYWKGARHTGVDIAGPTGTAIYAADDGVVAIAGWNRGGYGNMMVLDHGGGIYTRYAHNSKMLYQVGDTVKKGDTIALMGSTGRSTGPHLHFEVMVGSTSRRVNPFDYVR